MKTKVTLYYFGNEGTYTVDLDDVLQGFKNLYMKQVTMEFKMLTERDKITGDIEAECLTYEHPLLRTCGYFEKINGQNILFYSGLVMIQFGINDEIASEIRKKIESIPYTYTWFTDLFSTCHIIILVRVDSGSENHKEANKQIIKYYQEALEVKIEDYEDDFFDDSCWCTFQPDLYLNQNYHTFHVALNHDSPIVLPKNESRPIEDYE